MTQSQTDPEGQSPYLIGPDARAWFYGLPQGGQILDAHLVSILESFGPGVEVRYRAPVSHSTGQAQYLILELDLPVDHPDAMDRLVDVQLALLAQRKLLRERTELENPFANIVVSLGQAPANWEHYLSNLVVDQ